MRIRILLLIKAIGICDHWSIEPPGLHSERPRPSTTPKLINFDFNADPDSAFHYNVGFQKECGSMLTRIRNPASAKNSRIRIPSPEISAVDPEVQNLPTNKEKS